jgi:hypothetical protein
LVGNDGNHADRFDLSLRELFPYKFNKRKRKFSYVRVAADSLFKVNARYFSSSPFKISSTSFARNKVKFVGSDDSEHPNSINHFRSSKVIIRRHNDGYFL